MNYEKAKELLDAYVTSWKPEGEVYEMLIACLEALDSCIEREGRISHG